MGEHDMLFAHIERGLHEGHGIVYGIVGLGKWLACDGSQTAWSDSVLAVAMPDRSGKSLGQAKHDRIHTLGVFQDGDTGSGAGVIWTPATVALTFMCDCLGQNVPSITCDR